MKYLNMQTKKLIHCPRCKYEHLKTASPKSFSVKCLYCEQDTPIAPRKIFLTGQVRMFPSYGNPRERQFINKVARREIKLV